MANLRIRPRNFDRAAARIEDRSAVTGALRDVFAKGADYLVEDVTKHRPISAGVRAIGAFEKHVEPLRASVAVGSLKSFDVARALNYGRRYHYRRGPYAGKPTAGWFTGALKRRKAAIATLLRKAATMLEHQLGD